MKEQAQSALEQDALHAAYDALKDLDLGIDDDYSVRRGVHLILQAFKVVNDMEDKQHREAKEALSDKPFDGDLYWYPENALIVASALYARVRGYPVEQVHPYTLQANCFLMFASAVNLMEHAALFEMALDCDALSTRPDLAIKHFPSPPTKEGP